jgi:hypothetical protein
VSEGYGRRYLVSGGAAACAVCCAPPLLALVGIAGAGTVATVATFVLAGIVFGLVVAAASIAALLLRKQRRDTSPGRPEPHETAELLPDPVRRPERSGR